MLKEQQREENIEIADCDLHITVRILFRIDDKKEVSLNTNSTPINTE